ncbi:RNA polymerase sigma-70 factor [Luteipulveratus halotolerans]|uniref:RNA polymerase sigma24 factor n=1 Tax=Luteipulveratus halotolerans TaxID=1631356 RepID=A0A0L6CHW2_9MICO|nr:RNA polymerase sigma-70 factor [Luteipulveratus halotolerans]KNX37309.1 RNA polymerase sigma24 factor [Luteipulveratus halotolerans]
MTHLEDDHTALAEEFMQVRPRLVGAAYRIVGGIADAEDVVQEAWLRWSGVDRSQARDATAYLLTVTTRLALNRLRQQRSRREDYVGPWLPEPSDEMDVEASVEMSESVSMAMMVVLETLTPLERATFVLHDVFGLTYSEVARAIDRSDAAARQLGHRARSHVEARRPRQVVDRVRHREVTDRFVQAASTGDIAGLLELLAPEVVLVSDGGGFRQAALRPVEGADKVSRFIAGTVRKGGGGADLAIDVLRVNGESAIVVTQGDDLDSVCFLTVEETGITALHLVRNPHKLGGVRASAARG